MKELYDKVQASIKDSFKDFIPMDSEKEREMLKEKEKQKDSQGKGKLQLLKNSHQRSLKGEALLVSEEDIVLLITDLRNR
ncbi:hypothetical protein Tco_0436898, partial [Tanacetum coccineum]